VLPALIHKMHAAKSAGSIGVEIWGTGSRGGSFSSQRRHGGRFRDDDNLPDDAFDDLLRGPNGFPLVNIGCAKIRPSRTSRGPWRRSSGLAAP